MHLPSNSSAPSHLTSARRLLSLHLIRARERAGLSRSHMAERTDFSPDEIERVETGARLLDVVELRAWCRATGAPVAEFVRAFDAALSAQEAREEAQEMARDQEATALKNATNIYLLRFAPGALPTLLAAENAPHAIQSLLGTAKVRVFATGSPATLGLSAALSTQENSARGADEQGECTLLHPTEAFVVVVGAFAGARVAPSAPRNQGLDWAPLAPWVPLCPGTLDLAIATDWERLKLGALSPLQVEFALATFAPRLSHGAVEDIVGAHPDSKQWMAQCNERDMDERALERHFTR